MVENCNYADFQSWVYTCVYVSPVYSRFLCVSVSSNELEPEPIEELSWLSCVKARKPSPDSERDGVSVSERILSRLLGLINFLIFRVIQFPRLQRTYQADSETERPSGTKKFCFICVFYLKALFQSLNLPINNAQDMKNKVEHTTFFFPSVK